MTRSLRLLAATAAIGVASLLAAPAATASGVPFDDPNAAGQLTLCDTQGHAMTGGSIDGKPFVWRAVGSTAATGSYGGTGRTATLYGFQPIDQVDPGQWVGDYLTASATYTNPSRPMAAATAVDRTLADLLAAYPTKWDGLVQLRMFLAAPGQAPQTTSYDAAVIKVSGNRWTLVSGGHSGCHSGTARSSEEVLPEVRKLGTPAPGATSGAPGRRNGGTGTSSSSDLAGSTSGAGTSSANAAGAPVDASNISNTSASGGSHGTTAWPWVLGALLLLAAAGYVLRNRLTALLK